MQAFYLRDKFEDAGVGWCRAPDKPLHHHLQSFPKHQFQLLLKDMQMPSIAEFQGITIEEEVAVHSTPDWKRCRKEKKGQSKRWFQGQDATCSRSLGKERAPLHAFSIFFYSRSFRSWDDTGLVLWGLSATFLEHVFVPDKFNNWIHSLAQGKICQRKK